MRRTASYGPGHPSRVFMPSLPRPSGQSAPLLLGTVHTYVRSTGAMAGARTLLILAAAVSLLVVPAAAAGGASKNKKAAVKRICKATSFPDVCVKTAGKHVKHYRTVDALTVLEMQVDAFSKRAAAARKRVARKVRKASPGARRALSMCGKFYFDVEDNLGACRRAIRHKDAVTIRATMGMAAQDMQNCDEQFRQVGEKNNPLERVNQSLGKMAEVCRSLSNMI